MPRFFSLVVVLGVTLVLLAIASPATAQSSTVVVSIPKGAGIGPSAAPGYNPATVTVVVGVNNTVVWENNDTVAHTVTPGNMPTGATWAVGSGNMPAGTTYSFTFTVPGTYTYSCAYHGWMSGTVVVKGASPVPEFPASSLAILLFAAVAAAALMLPRLGVKPIPAAG
jgi:plastocyanin